MKKTLVIFDVDGTLVYSNKVDSLCFAATYEAIYGLPFPTIDWTQYPHVTDTTIFRTVIWQHFGREADGAEMLDFQHRFVESLEHNRRTKPSEFPEVPSARRTVERLLDDECFVVAVATGGWLRPATLKLRHVEIPAHRLTMAGADGHETREAIIGQVQQAVGEVARTVYVGDAPWDVQVTRRLNMNFVGIRRLGDVEVLERDGASVVLRDYEDYDLFLEAVFSATPPKPSKI